MPDWLDSDSLIVASRGPYRFGLLPAFWEYIESMGDLNHLASSQFVLEELTDIADDLRDWARQQGGSLFRTPSDDVQEAYRRVVDSVNTNSRFAPHHVRLFLSRADPWLIAHAIAEGGRIVTFEKSEVNSRKPKIPDVARPFGVNCVNLWDWLSERRARF